MDDKTQARTDFRKFHYDPDGKVEHQIHRSDVMLFGIKDNKVHFDGLIGQDWDINIRIRGEIITADFAPYVPPAPWVPKPAKKTFLQKLLRIIR